MNPHGSDANEQPTLLHNHARYDSFGKLTATNGSLTNPFRYTGREFDSETGLYYYRARYYDATIGRFLSGDPVGFDAGPNFYSYVLNDPLNWIDPSGRQQDSVTSALLQAIRSGNPGEIENILDAADDVLSDDAKNLGRQAIKRLRTPCGDLVSMIVSTGF